MQQLGRRCFVAGQRTLQGVAGLLYGVKQVVLDSAVMMTHTSLCVPLGRL